MKSTLISQYEMVLDARKVLLDYCLIISPENFIRSSNDFGRGGSIRNLLVHICNSYQGWLGKFAQRKDFKTADFENYPALSNCVEYFTNTNELVFDFLGKFENNYYQSIEGIIAGNATIATPLKIFMHTVTHEFHHKGQILSLSRLWGYTPIDTDILR